MLLFLLFVQNLHPHLWILLLLIDSINTHPLQTRSMSHIHLHRINPTLLLAHCEPKSVKQALQDPNWLSVMQQEYDALIKNHTWDLVSLPPGRKPIGCKWVFRVKENAYGSINKYKARLVAKGFNQAVGFDFSKIFSLVVKPVTINLF